VAVPAQPLNGAFLVISKDVMFEVGYTGVVQSTSARIGKHSREILIQRCTAILSVDELFRVLLPTFQPCAL